MKQKLITLAISLITLLSFSAFVADDDPFAALLKKLEEFTKKYPQEKVYLHLDKPYYAVGDNIWFKAYVIDAKTAEPSIQSNILYVELIDERDSIKQQLKLPMQSGVTWGDIKLVDSLSEGNYRIRAYTQWMRNAGPNFFFDKTIKIGNAWANKVFTSTNHLISSTENDEKISSTIKFYNKEGAPYANVPVNYQVQLGNKNISRGKAITNAQGEVTVSFANTQADVLKSGKILATITLGKQQIVKTILLKSTSKAIDFQFFPEGGNIVDGLPIKVAFKATNTEGLGEDVTGKIVDNENNEVVAFESTHLGIGSFMLNPIPGKTYTAHLKLADGIEKKVALPKSQSSGYVIAVNNFDSTKLNIKVFMSADLLQKGTLKLIAQHQGNVYFTANIPTEKQSVSINLPKQELRSGIVQLTLLSATDEPILERIAFINNGLDKIDLTVSSTKSTYFPREKVDISFNSSISSKPIQGSFSVAVTNTNAVKPDPENESNILTSLLLTSDLAGYVEKPNYYFLNKDQKTQTALDHLLLTQGWRKIVWKEVLGNSNPAILFPAEKSIKISGKITKGNKPVVKGKVSLFSTQGGFFAIDTLSDENGRFNFEDFAFSDSTKFIVQARTDKNNKNINIDLDIQPNQVVTPNKNTGDVEVNVNQSMMTYLQQSSNYFDEQNKKGLLEKTILLDEVKVVEKKNLTPNSRNLNGAGHADQVFTAKSFVNSYSLSQFLGGRMAGVSIRAGKAYMMRGNGPMSIVLDGMAMAEDFELDMIPIMDIESVEVLKSIGNTAIYGSRGSNGILLITTKIGAGTEGNYARYTPGIVTYSPKGYYASREFYSPKYDVNPDSKPDFRSTVYWEPQVISNPEGKGNFSFFNTDEKGTYRVVIEGIDIFGNLARKIYTYEVK